MDRIVRRRPVPRQIAKVEAREKVGKHVDRAALDLMKVLKFDEEEAYWGGAQPKDKPMPARGDTTPETRRKLRGTGLKGR